MRTKKDPFNDPFFTDTNKFIRKHIAINLAITLVMLIGFCFLLNYVISEGNKKKEVEKSFVGKQVVIEKDTMTIIDYSTFKQTYKLSNGIEYDMDFVKSKAIQ